MTVAAKPRPIATPKVGGALAACVGLACAALLTPFVSGWESGGKQHLRAYKDIVGVWTVCDGDTYDVRPGMIETAEGCELRLDKQLTAHAKFVLACTPTLRGHDRQLAAAVSLAYNIGTGGYCRSTVARRFNAGNWRDACDAMLMWNKAGGRVVAGLTNRRRAERALCLQELPA
jgi:lysozyme